VLVDRQATIRHGWTTGGRPILDDDVQRDTSSWGVAVFLLTELDFVLGSIARKSMSREDMIKAINDRWLQLPADHRPG